MKIGNAELTVIAKYSLIVMPPVLNHSNRVYVCQWPSCSSRSKALNLGFGHFLLSLDVFDPRKDDWVRLADDFLHS